MEAGYGSTKFLNDEPVDRINNQTFKQGSAILKKKRIITQNT